MFDSLNKFSSFVKTTEQPYMKCVIYFSKSEEQRLASKRKKENKRKHVIEEVVHTEKEYVKQLDLIIEKIMDPLAKVEVSDFNF